MDQTLTIPLVSVIMPAYNAENYIVASIKSVQDQTFQNWELIVVDDGSTDGTAARVKKMQQGDRRVHYFYQKNKKQAAARNTGIRASRGTWIAFLDSDDLWHPTKLALQLAAAESHQPDIVFSQGLYLYQELKRTEPYDNPVGKFSGFTFYKSLFRHNHIPVLSVLIKKSVIEAIGPQDESHHAYGCEDWDYWLRASREDFVFYGMAERLFYYRVHELSMSRNKLWMHMAGCFVRSKNYDKALLNKGEKALAEKSLTDGVCYIVNQLYDQKDLRRIPDQLYLLNNMSRIPFKSSVAKVLVKLFGLRSKRLVAYLIKH